MKLIGGLGLGLRRLRASIEAPSARRLEDQKNSSIWPKMTSTVFLGRPLFNFRKGRVNPLKSYFPVDLDHLVC